MHDVQFLAQEAHKIHGWFQGIFYVLVTGLLLLSILVEYFKWPLGNVPSFAPLVGRTLIAAILLHTYPTVANLMADLSDALSRHLGELSAIRIALDRLGDKVEALTWSWTSVRESVIIGLSYLSFFLLYFSVHVAQAIYLYALVVLYVFSPVLIALFVPAATAGATSALYRSLIEVSLWKPVWCVLATLLWTTGISGIQAEGSTVNLLSAICFCLVAAGSMVLTPVVVHALSGAGLAAMSHSFARVGVDGVGTFSPLRAGNDAMHWARRGYNLSVNTAERASENRFPALHQRLRRIPRFAVRPLIPVVAPKPKEKARPRKEDA